MMDCGFTHRRDQGAARARLGLAPGDLAGHRRHARARRPPGRCRALREAPRDPGLPHARHRAVAARGLSRGARAPHRFARALRDRRPRGRAASRCRTTRASRCSTSSATARSRLGVVTDLGLHHRSTSSKSSPRCDALVLECNHDLDMLMSGSYPVSLKQRVSGRFGHLSNARRGRAAREPRLLASCGTSSPRTSRSRTTPRRSRSPRSPARWAARTRGSASRPRKPGSTGARSRASLDEGGRGTVQPSATPRPLTLRCPREPKMNGGCGTRGA